MQQQEELKRLRQELDQLKTKDKLEKNQGLERLSEELKKFGGEQQVSIKAMRPSSQARQTFPESAIRRRAESLKRYGQQMPVITYIGKISTRLTEWKRLSSISA